MISIVLSLRYWFIQKHSHNHSFAFFPEFVSLCNHYWKLCGWSTCLLLTRRQEEGQGKGSKRQGHQVRTRERRIHQSLARWRQPCWMWQLEWRSQKPWKGPKGSTLSLGQQTLGRLDIQGKNRTRNERKEEQCEGLTPYKMHRSLLFTVKPTSMANQAQNNRKIGISRHHSRYPPIENVFRKLTHSPTLLTGATKAEAVAMHKAMVKRVRIMVASVIDLR